MKKMILGVTLMSLMMVMLGFTFATPKVYADEVSYSQEDIDWDVVTETCISQGISMDFGIPMEDCSQEFVDKINSGNFTEYDIYSYFCSNFPEYPNLVVETLGMEVVLN